MPNTTDTARLRELLGAATKGPWKIQQNIRCVVSDAELQDYGNVVFEYPNSALEDSAKNAEANAAAIVAVMNYASDLLDELNSARTRVTELEQGIASANTASAHFHSKIVEAQEGIAARDARMKAEGAAEWLEQHANEVKLRDYDGIFKRTSGAMMEDAKRLREGGE